MVGWLFVVVRAGLGNGRVVVGSLVQLLMAALVVSIGVALPSVLTAVPPILDCVVAAAFESSGDFGPPLAHLLHQLLDQLAFLWCDGFMVQGGLEVLVKSLAALFW